MTSQSAEPSDCFLRACLFLANFFGLNWRNLKHVGFRWRSFIMSKSVKILVALPFLLGVAMGQVVINDGAILRSMEKKMSQWMEVDLVLKGKGLVEGLEKAEKSMDWEEKGKLCQGGGYDELSGSVYLISHTYDCGKCDKWHLGGVATAWCLRSDGLMVTNYHVLDNDKGEAWAVCSRRGEVFEVVEVLAASKENDLVVFRVNGKGMKALRLGKTAEVGEDVRVISHPNRNLYMQTTGEVSRYFNEPRRGKTGPVRMGITADYAKGSSGGPVMNARGEVVGVVASTNSIYYNRNKDGDATNLQMVLKNTIPVSALHKMLKQ